MEIILFKNKAITSDIVHIQSWYNKQYSTIFFSLEKVEMN